MIGDSLTVTPARMGSGIAVAIMTMLALASLVASLVVLWRGFKRFEPETRKWIAGFFEQGTPQSSTRLVGVLSFFAATVLCAIIVVAFLVGAWLGVKDLASPSAALTTLLISVVTLLFANACVALGIRKSGDQAGESPSTPAASP